MVSLFFRLCIFDKQTDALNTLGWSNSLLAFHIFFHKKKKRGEKNLKRKKNTKKGGLLKVGVDKVAPTQNKN